MTNSELLSTVSFICFAFAAISAVVYFVLMIRLLNLDIKELRAEVLSLRLQVPGHTHNYADIIDRPQQNEGA